MRFIFLFLMCFFSAFAHSQGDSINHVITNNILANYPNPHKHYRTVMQPKKTPWQKINPFHYLSIGLMFTYQRVITQQLNGSCVYENSCSQYTKYAVNYYGIVKGTFLGFNQLQTCYPTSFIDYPDHKINPQLKIINSIPILYED